MKILIIEDDIHLEQVLSLRLRENGHEVKLAENGREALQALESEPGFDVILCDVVMPELSGPSFIREMRRRTSASFTDVIMMSALTDGESFIRKLEVGYDYYLPKPFTLSKLNELLAEIANKRNSRAS